MDKQRLNLCLVQADLIWQDHAANRKLLGETLAEQAGLHDLIVLPEMFPTGFTMAPAGLAEPAHAAESISWMQDQAGRLGAVLMGSLPVQEGQAFFNRLVAVGGEGPLLQYDKRHLFRMAGEQKVYTGGQDRPVLQLKGWRIAPQICYDLRFPVWARRSPSYDYDLLLYLANWPEKRVHHWTALLQARAIENQAFVGGVNRVGTDGNGIVYNGESAILDAQGQRLAFEQGKAALLTASLDPVELASYRERFPAWQDADSFKLD